VGYPNKSRGQIENKSVPFSALLPPGHRHLRATIRLHSGEEIVLKEATLANLVRGYVGIKTHP